MTKFLRIEILEDGRTTTLLINLDYVRTVEADMGGTIVTCTDGQTITTITDLNTLMGQMAVIGVLEHA